MPNPPPFSLFIPNARPKSDEDHATNLQALADWDRRIAATGRTRIFGQRLSASVATLTINNIPQTFNHLHLLVNGASTNAGGTGPLLLQARFNNDSTANYFYQHVGTIGGAAPNTGSAGSVTSTAIGSVADTGGRVGVSQCTIIDYANKFFSKEGNYQFTTYDTAASWAYSGGFYWANSSPITSITLFPSAGNLKLHTLVTLYGEY